MNQSKTAAIVLAAGLGTRMKSSLPKALHPIAGRPMLLLLLDTVAEARIDRVVVVVGPEFDDHLDAIRNHPTKPEIALQRERDGTGHAVLAARDALAGFEGDVLILFAGDPLITPERCDEILSARREAPLPTVVVVGKTPDEPGSAGRLITEDGRIVKRIVEYKDATEDEREITLCNAGLMAVDGTKLFGLLDRTDRRNAQKEQYLTDIVGLVTADGGVCTYVAAPDDEVMGIDTRADLARAERIVQDRLRAQAMKKGVTLLDPETVYLSWDTKLAPDVTVGPNVVFGPGVSVDEGAEIRAFSHLEQARVAANAVVGPFARLRPGAEIGEGAHVGNFVEIKNAVLGAGAKANHLTYIGDASVGAGANIGAGTITCNYDGFLKHRTEIGAHAFIGSNSALVAPVSVGDGAVVGAGSVITKDVAADALAVARGDQSEIEGWAKKQRAAKTK